MNDDHSFNKLSDDLAKMIKQSHENLEAYLLPLEKAIDDIIAQKSSDISAIEHLLDTVSSLMYAGIGHQVYLKLLEYYKTVDRDGADFYWKLYEEITE